MKTISKILTVFLLIAALQSCNDDDGDTPTPPEASNIVETASSTDDLSSLVAALIAADGDLVNLLSGGGPFTVLAPTNSAFDDFLSENGYGDVSEVPTDVLSQILLNHVISGEVTSSDLMSMGSGYTNTNATGAGSNNLSLYFNTAGDVRFNDVASVSSPDVEASNGIIHIVDAVIELPNLVDHAVANPSLSDLVAALTAGGSTTFTDLLSTPGEFTVFAPDNTAFDAFTNPNGNDITDILSNHVIVGATAVSGGLSNSYVNTAATYGDSDNYLSLYINTDNGVVLNGSVTVATADIVGTNGVIHVVDEVIDIPTVVTFATADPDFSSLVAALTRDDQPDFVTTLSTPNDGGGSAPFTVFAPADSAFAALLDSDPAWNSLDDIDGALLTSVLQHHVIAGANVRAGDLTDGITPETLEGDLLTINLPGNDGNPARITDGAGNGDIDIIAVDVQAGNGVIHVIETVLIPDTMN